MLQGPLQRSCEATSRRAPPGHTPHGDLTEVSSPATEEPFLLKSRTPRPAIRARKGVNVQTKPRIETGSLILEPVPVQHDVAARKRLTATATVPARPNRRCSPAEATRAAARLPSC